MGIQSSVERGLIARLLLGETGSRVSLAGRSIIVAGKPEHTIPLARLTGPARIEPERWWARLELTTEAGTETIHGFNASALQSFANQVNSALRQRALAALDPGLRELRRVHTAWADLKSTSEYLRDSAREDLASQTESALNVRNNPFWDTHASAEHRRLANELATRESQARLEFERANELFVQRELERFSDFFNSVESRPLTVAQRQACVINEHNNLVLAGAGTGKTSTMIGRAGYLIASGKATADQVLMLAYNRDAAHEMQERQDARLSRWCNGKTPTIKTFHALGLEIIGKAEGRRPDISRLAEDDHALHKFIDSQIDSLTCDEEYASQLVQYCGSERFPYRSPFDFASKQEYDEYVRDNELRALNGTVVKSFEEIIIANWLSAHGVAFEYEHPYEVSTSGPDYRQYKPDFFLTEYGIYIEHFALDDHGHPPAHFAHYMEGVEWKRRLHQEHGTKLIETYSYLRWQDRLEVTLQEELTAAGVLLTPRTIDELLDELRGAEQVANFAKLLAKVLTVFKQSDASIDDLRSRVEADSDARRSLLLLRLFEPVLTAYEAELRRRNEIDFGDMIRRAAEHLESGAWQSPFAHILIDEFQDISAGRARLVRALLAQSPDTTLFAVGDDWQAIYRFAGSDISYITRFDHWFGPTATTPLDRTFRFNNRIGRVASQFVQKNPSQLCKQIASTAKSEKPCVSLVRALKTERGLQMALEAIARQSCYGVAAKPSVLVLGRYNFSLNSEDPEMQLMIGKFPNLDVTLKTVHSSKGKEADYVVIVGLTKGRHGFPSERSGVALLEFLLPRKEPYPLAEERRLFYVALTRARHRVYLVYDPVTASPFISELLEGGYDICTDEFSMEPICAEIPIVPCPSCSDGSLTVITGPRGPFFGCTNYPYCRHSEQGCPTCGGPMRRRADERVCVVPGCEATVELCPKCGSTLVERRGPGKRPFLGCQNYRGDAHYSCRYTRKYSERSA